MNNNKSVVLLFIMFKAILFKNQNENGLYMDVYCDGILDYNLIFILIGIRTVNAVAFSIFFPS